MKKYLFPLTVFLFLIVFSFKEESKPKITYYFDPLCGWCYAFSSVMDSIQANYKNKVDFEVIPGGMVTGNKVGPVKNISDFLLKAIPGVEKMTGAKFGDPFLQNLKKGEMIYNSTPPSLAFNALKELQPKNQVTVASTIQKAIYLNGQAPMDTATYGSIAKFLGEDSLEVISGLKSQDQLQKTQSSFQKSKTAGITGFPAVFIEVDGEKSLLTRGYSSYDKFEKALKKYLK